MSVQSIVTGIETDVKAVKTVDQQTKEKLQNIKKAIEEFAVHALQTGVGVVDETESLLTMCNGAMKREIAELDAKINLSPAP